MSQVTTERYGLGKTVAMPYAEAVEAAKAALKEEGFGVLCEIDVKATLKAKIGVEDFRPYVILGACKPNLAYQGLTAEPDLGLLLPCNMVVYAQDDQHTVVKAIEPGKMLSVVENPALDPVADEVRASLTRALERIGS